MATTPRHGKPYVWVTWAASVLAGDKSCQWAPWFKAHFKYQKRPDSSFDLAAWNADHTALTEECRAELEAAGWRVTVETPNKFNLIGQRAILGGKPDIVAVKGADVLVVDCKTGQARQSDWWQVLLYMLALPKCNTSLASARIHGEIRYRDRAIQIAPEELNANRKADIVALMNKLGAGVPLPKVPTEQECAFCDIGSVDCPDRLDPLKPSENAILESEF